MLGQSLSILCSLLPEYACSACVCSPLHLPQLPYLLTLAVCLCSARVSGFLPTNRLCCFAAGLTVTQKYGAGLGSVGVCSRCVDAQ